ncbi:MAG: bi-domain-containing oxidoreductase [Rhizomicrobium sp.]
MKQIAQNYRNGELALLDVPVPACQPGGVLVRTIYSVISSGTEMMKVKESRLSLVGKARARPDQVRKVLRTVRQQGVVATYQKVMNRLDSLTPLGYSLAGEVVEVGEGVTEFKPGDLVACGGNKYALHAEYNWVPVNLCVSVPKDTPLNQAAFATIASVSLQAFRQSEIKLGETACVIGLGLLGQVMVGLLRAAGANVVGLDISEERCRLAETMGAKSCAKPGGADYARLTSTLASLTAGAGADCIFLCSNTDSNDPVLTAVELARDRARVVDVGKTRLDLPWSDYYEKELDVRFSRSYGPGRYDPIYEEYGVDYPIGYVRWTERRNMACIVDMIHQGKLDLAPLISAEVAFDDAVATYNALQKGEMSGIGFVFRYPDTNTVNRRIDARPKPATAAKNKVKLAVIGCGNYTSSMLMPHLVGNSDVELVEVVTNSSLSATDAQRKFGFQRFSTDSAGVLEDRDIDAVVIGTRHDTHAELAAMALRAGKAVFVEKPLALDEDGLAQVRAAANESGNDRLMVGFNRRFAPLLAELKKSWGPRNGPHVVNYRINAGSVEKGSWYLDRMGQGSRFAGEGGHFVDTVSWWLGADPVRVSRGPGGGDPDDVVVTYGFADGSVATVSYLTKGDPAFPKELIDIYGESRCAVFHNFESFEIWTGGKKKRAKSGAIDKGQKEEVAAFVRAIKTGGPMPIAIESLFATTSFTLAAQNPPTADVEPALMAAS